MKQIHTDEKDERFLSLVEELDYGYYQRIGDELEKYNQYNEFKDPHIVILMIDGDDAIACASYRKFDEKSVEFKRPISDDTLRFHQGRLILVDGP